MDVNGRQFVAGPNSVERRNLDRVETFCSIKIGFHQKLAVTKVVDSNRELVALGHLIDPAQPEADNEEVLQTLAGCRTFDVLENQLAGLGGRWLLFSRIGDAIRLYPDAGGSKSVFYTVGWVASQPGLLGYPI